MAGVAQKPLTNLLRLRLFPSLACSLAALVLASPVLAQANQWTGTFNTDFNTAKNWTAGPPTGNVIIDYRTNQPKVSGPANVTGITANADMSVGETGSLTVGTLTTTAGTFDNRGTIIAGQPIQNGSVLTNQATGRIEGGVATGAGAMLTNGQGAILGGVTVARTGLFLNDAGLVQGGLVNNGSVVATGQIQGDILNTGTGNLSVRGGALTGNGALTNAGVATVDLGGNVTGLTSVTNTSSAIAGIRLQSGTTLSAESVTNAAGSGLLVAGKLSSQAVIGNAGTLTLETAGSVNGGVANTGIVLNGGTINGGITSSGAVTNASTGIVNDRVVSSGTFANAGTVNGVVALEAGLFDNTGRLKDTVTVIGGRLVSVAPTSTIENGLINSASAEIAGTLTGPIDNRSGGRITIAGDTHGDGVLTNAAGATLALSGGNATGLNRVENAGDVTVAGAHILGTAGFNNLATGSISSQNGTTGDRLTINGPYSGVAGSKIALDVDLSKSGNVPADRVVINGTATGTTTLALTNVAARYGLLASPIEVLSVGAGSTLAVYRGRIASMAYVNYYLDERAPGSGLYEIFSRFNAAPLASMASGLGGALTSLSSSLHQPLHPIISRPVGCAENELIASPFLRVVTGSDRINATGSSDAADGHQDLKSKVSGQTTGIHGGLSLGVCNVAGSLWSLSVALSGGQVSTSATARTDLSGPAGMAGSSAVTRVKLDMPFMALHGLASYGGFNLELGAQRNSTSATFATSGDGVVYAGQDARTRAQGWSFTALASYRLALPSAFYLEPVIGISTGTASFGAVRLATGPSDALAFGSTTTGHVRAGVTFGTSLRLGNGAVVSPFAHAALWNPLGGAVTGTATLSSIGETVTVKGDSAGMFGQFGGGLMFRSAAGGVSGFVRGDMRFGSKLQGSAFNAGARLAF